MTSLVEQRPIIICGGSLAGLSAAIKLKSLGYEPCILEKNIFPREKLCGEFLGPDAVNVLQELGLLKHVSQHAYGPITDTYFYNLKGESLHIPLSMISKATPYALAAPRNVLDYALQKYARDQKIEIIENTRILPQLKKFNEQFVIQSQQESHEIIYNTPLLIDASGRYGGLEFNSRKFETSKRVQTLSLQCHVNMASSDKSLKMFFFPGGYGGLQPLSPETANLCMIFSKTDAINSQDLFSEMLKRIRQNPAANLRLKDVTLAGQINTTGPLNSQSQDTGLLQVGDAKLTIDPLTGTGMSHALETGILVAEIIHGGMQADIGYKEIQAKYNRRYHQKYGLRLSLLQWFRPLLFSTTLQNWTWPILKASAPLFAPIIR